MAWPMHGIIFAELRRYAENELGPESWPLLVADAGLSGKLYQVAQQFPDSEFRTLLAAIARALSRPAETVLQDFGSFIAPGLLKMHAHSIRPDWRTLDVIEHTERAIHQVIRQGDSYALPPEISVGRISSRELLLGYRSGRKLCPFAKGIILGIAHHYAEDVVIDETTCMLDGADCCRMKIHLADSSRPAG